MFELREICLLTNCDPQLNNQECMVLDTLRPQASKQDDKVLDRYTVLCNDEVYCALPHQLKKKPGNKEEPKQKELCVEWKDCDFMPEHLKSKQT